MDIFLLHFKLDMILQILNLLKLKHSYLSRYSFEMHGEDRLAYLFICMHFNPGHNQYLDNID